VRRFTLASAAATVLCACAALPEFPPLPPGGFELSGRVTIRYGKDSESGKLFWRHSDRADELLITSPLGQGIARVSREGAEYRLVTEDAKERRAADAESLTEDALGWRLPLAGLPDWVQGRPGAGRSAELRRDADGRPLELRQDGWRVEYEAFREAQPAKLRMSRDDLEIRLVIDRWTK
jgi:outer membrane lipoprotein LolB